MDALLQRQRRLEDRLASTSDLSKKRSRGENGSLDKRKEMMKLQGEGRVRRGEKLVSYL